MIVFLAWQYPFLLYTLAFPVAVVVFLWFEEPVTGDDAVVDENDATGHGETTTDHEDDTTYHDDDRTDGVGDDPRSLRDLLSYR